jgi:hypothetical protein
MGNIDVRCNWDKKGPTNTTTTTYNNKYNNKLYLTMVKARFS